MMISVAPAAPVAGVTGADEVTVTIAFTSVAPSGEELVLEGLGGVSAIVTPSTRSADQGADGIGRDGTGPPGPARR